MKSPAHSRIWYVAMLTVLCHVVYAKPETARLSVSGPGIPRVIETTAPEAIAPSVWAGEFVDWDAVTGEPAATWPRYTVQFHVESGSGHTRLAYVVYYVWDADVARGYVYVPGPGDEWYRLNASSIMRDGGDGRAWRDGRWYHASDTWSHAIRQLLPHVRKPPRITASRDA